MMKLTIAAVSLFGMLATAEAQVSDPAEYGELFSAAMAGIRTEFPFGRVVFDRVIADTTKRLAPPVLSRKEHSAPEEWARQYRVEVVSTDLTRIICEDGSFFCHLPENIVAAIAFSEPVIRGDTATLIARYRENTGMRVRGVRTTVMELTLERSGYEWKVVKREQRATG